MTRLRRGLTFANVCSFLALTIAISTGGAYAANTVFSTDIVNGEVKTPDLATNAVTSTRILNGAVNMADIKAGAVTSSRVASDTLTASDIAGGESNGSISLGAGAVANGRCEDFSIGVGGVQVGDAVIVSANGAVPAGIMLYGARVPAAGTVTLKICNLSGGTMPAITNLPIAVVSITI
jgi:hypothetical protein